MGWQEAEGPRLCRMSLLPDADRVPDIATSPEAQRSTFETFSAHNLPSIEGLVRYFHAAACFPVQDTLQKAIKAVNFKLWPGLTYQNAARYCPVCKKTVKANMVQTRQHI